MRVFLDSDVIISSLISTTGAAHIITTLDKLDLFISNYSINETSKVAKRQSLDIKKLKKLFDKHNVVQIEKSLKEVKEEYKQYVSDINDAHVVAGAVLSKSDFLITYNLRHYLIDKIKSELRIIIFTPARFLQYLRSLGKF